MGKTDACANSGYQALLSGRAWVNIIVHIFEFHLFGFQYKFPKIALFGGGVAANTGMFSSQYSVVGCNFMWLSYVAITIPGYSIATSKQGGSGKG